MDLLTLLSLAFATFIYAISPGPGIFAVLATATRYGATPALWLSIGHTITDMLYVSIAIFALGILSALINHSMIYVQMFGAIYLLYIGYQQYQSKGVSFEKSTSKQSVLRLFLAGVVVGGTNPKTVIYYLSFMPLFINLNQIDFFSAIEVIFIVGITVLFSLSIANIVGLKLRQSIENPKVIKRINEITGITMILVGVFVGLY